MKFLAVAALALVSCTGRVTPAGPPANDATASCDERTSCCATPTVLARSLKRPQSLAFDPVSIYWTEWGTVRSDGYDRDSSVMRLVLDPLAGPSPVASGQAGADGLAVAEGDVYWTTTYDRTLMRAPTLGGGAVVLDGSGSMPGDIVVDDDELYWADYGLGEIRAMPRRGGAVRTLAKQGQPLHLVSDGSSLYWTTGEAIIRISKAGGPVAAVIDGTDPGGPLAVAGDELYWGHRGTFTARTPNGDAALRRTTLSSGTTSTLLTQLPIGGISVDSEFVYWTTTGAGTPGSGSVSKMRRGGGPAITIATGQDRPTKIAVHEGCIYWLNEGSTTGAGSVMRVAR